MHVVVVGAGIVGYAVAYELASRGAEVTVVDGRGKGQGATRASAGVLAPHIEGHVEALLRLGVSSLDRYDGFVERVAADARRPIEYRRLGTLQVARNDAEARELTRHAAVLERRGVPHTVVGGSEIRGIEPALAPLAAGLLTPQHGYVGVATLMAALADAAAVRGVSLLTSRVQGIKHDVAGRIWVNTLREALDAEAVVLAAGSWSGTIPIVSAAPPPVHPIRGQLLQLRFPAPPLAHVVWGAASYLVPWADGSLLAGATMEDVGFDESVTVAGVRHLISGAEELLPAVASAALHEARAGLRPKTSDELPIIGASSTMRGVFYATGHHRNGVLLAPLTAAAIANLVLEGRECEELALTRPSRFGL
ncbi:MAG: glycine oxidase ThiO [Acidobacteria bacterium]|nr:glycine oxidase ThiO [Acidobacteriota bacterium]